MPSYQIAYEFNKEIPPNIKEMGMLTLAEAYKTQMFATYSSFKCKVKDCYSCNYDEAAYVPKPKPKYNRSRRVLGNGDGVYLRGT